MAKTSKSNTSNTDNDANSGSEDIAAMSAELAELRASKAHADGEVATYRAKLRESELAKMSAQERAIVSDQEACDARLSDLESKAQSIEDQIAQMADEPGHGREIAKLTRELTTVTTNIDGETRKKDYLAGQREKVTNQNKQTREAAPAAGAKLLANGIDVSKLAAPTQAWLDKRPKAFSDVRYAKLIVAAAQKAVDIEGLPDNSPEFFKFVEDELNESPNVENDDDGEEEEIGTSVPERESYAPEKPQHRAAGHGSMQAAPPTRQTPAGGNGGGNRRQVSLSADEREAALNIYSHLPISDADKLVKYSEGKKYMAQRNNSHFRN